MCHTVGGVLVLLLALPIVRSDDKPRDKPTLPQEQYEALLKEHQDALQAFQLEYQKAKSDEERVKVSVEKYPNPDKLAARFLELAEKNPKDAVAFESLSWILTNDRGTGGKNGPADKAVVILLRDHLQSDKLVGLCQDLSYRFGGKASFELLREILNKSPRADLQAEACLAQAQRLSNAAQLVRFMTEQPEKAKGLDQIQGKHNVEEIQKAGVAKVEAESVHYFREFGEKYAAKLKTERLINVCQDLPDSAGYEVLLQTLLEKDERREVQGAACLALGRLLKNRAGQLPETQISNAEKLRNGSEELFKRAAEKYADVKLDADGPSIGGQAKGELFEIRFLVVGKEAPDIDGEDADGKKFKLSDYRGKVVLLDFWGHW
jgi:hypothetical protein